MAATKQADRIAMSLFMVAGAYLFAFPGGKQMLNEKHINHGLHG
jgi:hypothetical protein